MSNKVYKESIYLISNASTDSYPENSLTNFKNKLPMNISSDLNNGLEVAVSYVGFSNNFRNLPIPPNGLPSFLISDCIKQRFGLCQTGGELRGACPQPITFEYKDNEDGEGCFWHKYYFQDKYYSFTDIQQYFDNVNRKSLTNIYFDENRVLHVEAKTYPSSVTDKYDFNKSRMFPYDGSKYWILMHKTMFDAFDFGGRIMKEIPDNDDRPDTRIMQVQIPSKFGNDTSNNVLIIRTVYYTNELYYAIRITNEVGRPNNFLHSYKSDITSRLFPSVIRIICDNVSQQIFNDSFSRDLVVFCPDYSKKDKFYSTEFTTKQYVPISNTDISDISIKIVDEENQLIQLLPGPATLIRMDIRNRHLQKNSFNIRLTSAKTEAYPKNTNSIFKVKLPSKLELGRNWRIALTSISHPTVYSTFLEDEATRSIKIKEIMSNNLPQPKTMVLTIPNKMRIYSKEELINIIDEKMRETKIGMVKLDQNAVTFFFYNNVSFICSSFLLHILGYHGVINDSGVATLIKVVANSADSSVMVSRNENGMNEVNFEKNINMDFLKPNYIMVYSNIVNPTVIGGKYNNLLRVVPIRSGSSYYTLSDFKHKEYYELQNTEIDTIEIDLRAHDGNEINFASSQDTILNLEFSNYLEYSG